MQGPSIPPPSRFSKIRERFQTVTKNITIEPTFFLFTCALNITDNSSYRDNYYVGIEFVFVIFVTLLFGVWSDRFGRKLPLLLSLHGTIVALVILAIMSYFHEQIHVAWLLIPGFIESITGGSLLFYLMCFIHIMEISSERARTSRLCTLMGILIFAEIIGIKLGSMLWNWSGNTACFWVAVSLNLIGLAILSWMMKDSPLALRPTDTEEYINPFKEIFRSKICSSGKYVFNSRENLPLFRPIISVYFIVRITWVFKVVSLMLFLLLKDQFYWADEDLPKFHYFYESIMGSGCIIVACILYYFYELDDLIVGIITSATFIISDFLFAFSEKTIYIGGSLGIFNAIGLVVSSSILSKQVPNNEYGKIFCVCEIISGVLGGVPALIYFVTIDAYRKYDSFPGAGFLVTALLTCVTMLLFLYIFTKRKSLEERTTNVEAHPT